MNFSENNADSTSPKQKKSSHVGVIFWFAFALIIFILFLVNRNTIFTVLKKTGFFIKVTGTEPEFITHHNVPADAKTQPAAEVEITAESAAAQNEMQTLQLSPIYTLPPLNVSAMSGNATEASANTEDTTATPSAVTPQPKNPEPSDDTANSPANAAPETTSPATTAPTTTTSPATPTTAASTANAATPQAASTSAAGSSVQSQATPISEPAPKMEQHLFFIQIADDGTVLRKEVVRSIDKTVTPLTAAINALLKGPSATESGFMSLIPSGTRLLGASVNNGIASINFSDEFRFNRYGVEGYYGQLMQVVYTASAFSNIESVQFLIAGEKVDFLGQEGVYIGAPLSRGSFR